ncbi:MAG: UDPGP type 1 family protein, partial [Planctomycetia bacterium]|nr:UDPGP type 1 family protein [Planctomycetia bacterium]
MTTEVPQPLAEQLRVHRQDHVLRWWGELKSAERDALARQLAEIDLDQLDRAWQQITGQDEREESPAERARRAAAPRQLVRVAHSDADRREWSEARAAGGGLLRAGRVGAVLVAGGEGSRLGFPHPKGQFPIGPVSAKPLFQLFAEQLRARARAAGARIPWYVMTSDSTHDETVDFFRQHAAFGMDPRDVHFFRQGAMPAVDRQTGRLLMASRHELVLNPDGHGGFLAALDRSGLLDQMCDAGIDYVYYHQVDNPLARVCDPAFLGFHLRMGSEVSTKVVAKLSPEERMGVAVELDGRTQIIEYSDLPHDMAAERDAAGELKFWAGSTAIHVFSRSFLERLRAARIELPFHRAIKAVPHIDDAGALVEPKAENAIKFERFIFDVLPLAERSLVVEARRDDEFCPLKNKSGDFSAEHVKRSLSELYAGWLRSAGATIPEQATVEISPLYAFDPD